MRENLILMSVGLAFGAILSAGLYFGLQLAGGSSSEGAQFESLEDFRRAMLGRDERDVKADRSVSLRSIINPHPSDLVMFDLIPNLDVMFQGVPVRINSCGMRDIERSVAKPKDTFRIALLGDSFAFGWGVKREESFAAVMETLLSDFVGDAGTIEVLNFGVPGYSTFQEVALFEERGMDFNPDAVLVFFIENDFGLPFFIRDIHQAGKMMSSTSFAKKSWSGEDPLVTEQNNKLLKLLDSNKALQRLQRQADTLGIPVYVAINPNKKWEKVKGKLWALRRRTALRPVWIREEFLEIVERRQIEHSTLSLPHDPHPSAKKHAILGELLAAAFLPEVTEHFNAQNSDLGSTNSNQVIGSG